MSAATSTPISEALTIPARLPLRSDDTRLMYLSVSSLALFWRCPERWRRRYLEREREPQRGPMVVGKAVGGTIAAYFAALIAGESLSAADADDLCRAEFDERVGQAGTDFGEDDPDELREQSREALRAYLATLAPGVRPRSVERRFELRFERAEWSVIGYLDVEDERGYAIDVKVGAKHVTEARARRDPQASAYVLARLTESGDLGPFEFHSIRRGKVSSGERCIAVPAERTRAQLAAFAGRIAQTAREIARCAETGDWALASPDGWWCAPGQCSFWSRCAGGGMHAEDSGENSSRLAA